MAENRADDPRDPFGNPSGANSSTGGFGESGAPIRNRPAAGAREVDSPRDADTQWRPGPGATDFLGLEPELHAGDEASVGGATESWLFDLQQADGQSAPSVTATATRAPSTVSNTTTAESPSAVDEFADATEADLEADAPNPLQPARARSKRGLLLAASIAVLGAGAYFAWPHVAPRLRMGPEVSTAEPRPATARPSLAPEAKPSAPVASTPVAKAVNTNPVPPSADTSPAAPPPVPAVLPVTSDVVATIDTTASTPPPALTVEPITPMAEPAAPLTRSSTPTKDPELPTGAPGPGGGRHATTQDWSGMWLETTIPTDAIHGPTRVRTMNVGLVRAQLQNGEFVEGRLQAVGESRIWLDVELGRISLDAAELRSLAQIVGQQGRPVALGTQALAGLPRVEVLMPGGSMIGRVLGREGDLVTFVTEEGMRMRVDALDIRPAADGRTRLIGPVAARKP